jgi:Rha family phage regulatory protein
MKLIKMVDSDLVFLTRNKDAVTTSRALAVKFRKQHKDVLRIIDRLKDRSPGVFTGLKIALSHYKDDSGKRNKEYILNRDAYSFVAMSFTGKKADRFKFDFILAFNKMESWIKDRLKNSLEYQVMSETLQEVRKMQGKATNNHHYSNEARLVNWAITGKFSTLDREALPSEELDLLFVLQKRNSVLLGAGMPYSDRKESLKLFSELRKNGEE